MTDSPGHKPWKGLKKIKVKIAVERGPIVYCAEAVDNKGHALNLELADSTDLKAEHHPNLLEGITVIKGEGISLVPYYAWAHRDVGEMASLASARAFMKRTSEATYK